MAILEKVKKFLDWLAYGKLLFDLAVAISAGGLAKAVLTVFHVQSVWITPTVWLIGAAALAILLRVKWPISKREEKGQLLTIANSAAAKSGRAFDVARFMATTYNSVMQSAFEESVREWLVTIPAKEREAAFTRFIASGLIAHLHDTTWWTIYKSQIDTLMALNNAALPMPKVQEFYDAAAKATPQYYSTYSFQEWFGYLKDRVLIIELPGSAVGLTERGKDFLKHLVHWGYDINGKTR